VEYGYFFRVTPYRWNYQDYRLFVPLKSKGHWGYDWNTVKYLFLAHQVFLIVRVVQSLWNPKIFERFLVVGCTAAFSIETALQILLIDRGDDILNFVNRYIQFFLKIQGNTYFILNWSTFYEKTRN